MLFYLLYYNILSLTSLKITQAFHLLLGFAENQTVFWDFKIRNSIRITEGSDNGDSDNRGSTIPTYMEPYILGFLLQHGYVNTIIPSGVLHQLYVHYVNIIACSMTNSICS